VIPSSYSSRDSSFTAFAIGLPAFLYFPLMALLPGFHQPHCLVCLSFCEAYTVAAYPACVLIGWAGISLAAGKVAAWDLKYEVMLLLLVHDMATERQVWIAIHFWLSSCFC
jgi:hypothetical protein